SHRADESSLAPRLLGLSESEREQVVLELVQGETATVLGLDLPASLDPERAFKELGFSSLAAVELRNRLAAVTGLRLATTLAFDYPTPLLLVGHLLERMVGVNGAGEHDEHVLRQAFASIPIERLRRAGLADALLKLANSNGGEDIGSGGGDEAVQLIESMDVDGLVQRALRKTPTRQGNV
ncbi:MAG TPA: acyl carrier protein, partial [Solirubrobacteraceae bacterium]